MSDSKPPAVDPESEIETGEPTTIEPAAGEAVGAAEAPDTTDLTGFVRHGPGTLDSLRFKWTVRHEANGYFVDETIGASQSPVSRGPMSRGIALDYIEARYRDATARFEHRRDRLANAPIRPRRLSQPPSLTEAVAHVEPSTDPTQASAPTPEEAGLAQALLAAATAPAEETKKNGTQTVDLEDVMKRITQLLDER